MAAGDLTTLANVKGWFSPPLATTADDGLLARLITAASRLILNYLQRATLLSQSYTDTYDGSGGRVMVLRRWPVTAIGALAIDGLAIQVSNPAPTASGYLLEPWDGQSAGKPQKLSLAGFSFNQNLANVAVTYTAGYLVQGEAQTVPAIPGPYSLATLRSWAADVGVAYVGGAALTAVAANPGQGQYSVSAGLYSFNAADAGKPVAIAYSYLPGDIEQACLELVALRYKERERIGHVSKSLAGETVSFTQKDMSDDIKLALQPYRLVAPL